VVLLAGVLFIPLFRLDRVFTTDTSGWLVVLVVFVLPLIFCGWTLLSEGRDAADEKVA